MKKRGLSPVIASAMLIALVVVLAAIIFIWARGFISEQIEKFGQPVKMACEDVNFEINYALAIGGIDLDIVNRGNVDIYDLQIKKVVGGDSEAEDFKISVARGSASPSKFISFAGDNPEKLIISPKVLGSVKGKKLNKPFTCTEYSKSVNLD